MVPSAMPPAAPVEMSSTAALGLPDAARHVIGCHYMLGCQLKKRVFMTCLAISGRPRRSTRDARHGGGAHDQLQPRYHE